MNLGVLARFSQELSRCKLTHDAPGDGPLLHANETAALRRRSDLRDVDRDLRRADTNAEAVDDATDDEHGDVLRRSGDNRANDPDDCTEHDSLLAAEAVRDEARAERGEPGAAGHRGGDAALDIRARALARNRALVEVVEVVFGGDAASMLVNVSPASSDIEGRAQLELA